MGTCLSAAYPSEPPKKARTIKGIILLLERLELWKISGEELVEWHVVQGVVGIEGEGIQLLAFALGSSSDGCCGVFKALPRNTIRACMGPALKRKRKWIGV
jgi:hypothetical protein